MVDLFEGARGERPDAPRDLVPGDRNDFVDHHLRLQFQTGGSPGGHGNTKQRRVLQMAGDQAHNHAGVNAVEQIGLYDGSQPRLAVVSGRRTDDDVATLHLHAETSAKPYQLASCSFLETSSD